MNRKKYIFEVVACVVNKFLYQFLMLIWAGSKLVWISFKNSTNTFKDLIFFLAVDHVVQNPHKSSNNTK